MSTEKLPPLHGLPLDVDARGPVVVATGAAEDAGRVLRGLGGGSVYKETSGPWGGEEQVSRLTTSCSLHLRPHCQHPESQQQRRLQVQKPPLQVL